MKDKRILKQNLCQSSCPFAGETQARSKYNYFASQAKKGYEQISAIFNETTDNEDSQDMVQAHRGSEHSDKP